MGKPGGNVQTPAEPGVEGFSDERFDGVRSVFMENFTERGEVGAAVAVYLDGEPVVDLWGGDTVRNGERAGPWERDTLVCMFSVNKSVTALCAHRLADQGKLDYDKPVAHYWPEFAQAGKEDVTVRQLMGGLAALVYPDGVPDGKAFDWDAMIDGLAETAPAWPVGAQGAYHASTYGHLVGELVRRTSGQMPDDYFRKEIAEPFGIDYWFSVPAAERHRVSEVLPNPGSVAAKATDTLVRSWLRILPQPDILGLMNGSEHGHEVMPSAFGRGNARAIGKVYAALSMGGTLDGVTIMSPETLKKATTLQWEGKCGLTDRELRGAIGFFLNAPDYLPAGPNKNAFGHFGAGGAIGIADPERRLAFSYCTNYMCAGEDVGDRCKALIDAVFDAM